MHTPSVPRIKNQERCFLFKKAYLLQGRQVGKEVGHSLNRVVVLCPALQPTLGLDINHHKQMIVSLGSPSSDQEVGLSILQLGLPRMRPWNSFCALLTRYRLLLRLKWWLELKLDLNAPQHSDPISGLGVLRPISIPIYEVVQNHHHHQSVRVSLILYYLLSVIVVLPPQCSFCPRCPPVFSRKRLLCFWSEASTDQHKQQMIPVYSNPTSLISFSPLQHRQSTDRPK